VEISFNCAIPYLKYAELVLLSKSVNQPIFAWLTENSDSYRQMSQSIEKKRGQCLVHKNLCVARIKDLSLRVKVEKALSGNFKVLSDEYHD
jgi:hypothetical protein